MPSRPASERHFLVRLTPHTRRHVVQLLAERPLLRVSSGYRSPARNARVGGSPTSYHLRGRAVDLVGPTHDLVQAAGLVWALRLGPTCTGPEEVLLEDLGRPNQHLHVAW